MSFGGEIAVFRNDYPLLQRMAPLSPGAATMEALIIANLSSTGERLDQIILTRNMVEGYGIGGHRHYVRDLDQIASELLSYKVNLNGDGYQRKWVPLVSRFFIKNNGDLEIAVDENLTPYLVQLKANFTKIEIMTVATMAGQYSKKLYMLFKTYEFRGGGQLTIQELKDALGVSSIDLYKEFKRVRERLLDPAIKEINESTDIRVEYIQIKEMRKTAAVRFEVKANHQFNPKLPMVVEETEFPSGLMELLESYGFNDRKFLQEQLMRHGGDLVLLATKRFEKETQANRKTIKNLAGLYRTKLPELIEGVRQEQAKKATEILVKREEARKKAQTVRKEKMSREEKAQRVTEYIAQNRDELLASLDNGHKWDEKAREGLIRLEAMRRIAEQDEA